MGKESESAQFIWTLVCVFPLSPVQDNLAGELQYLWGRRCVYVCGQHPHRNWERKAAGIVNWASPPWRVVVICPLAGGSVFLFTFSWWWKLATAVFRAASFKEVLQCWHKERPKWMNYKSFGHLRVSVYSLSACLAHLANPATVRPPRTAAGCLDSLCSFAGYKGLVMVRFPRLISMELN